jgi:hypothetical protein
MTQKLLRFAYVCEFLLALMAIFTAWSEIGGQAALDLMHWGWKLGFSLALAASTVGYTTALVSTGKIFTLRAGRWLFLILLVAIGMGVVTYYYTLEEDSGESDEPSDTVTIYIPGMPIMGAFS